MKQIKWLISMASISGGLLAAPQAHAGCEDLAGVYGKCDVQTGTLKIDIAFTRSAVEIRKVFNDNQSVQVFRSYGDWTASTRIGVRDQLNCIHDELIVSSTDRGSYEPRRSEVIARTADGIAIKTFFGDELYETIQCALIRKR